MTMPNERTSAVLQAHDFLVRLSSAYLPDGIKKIPAEVRQEARRILRHFPRAYDIHHAAKASPDVFDTDTTMRWMDDL